MDIVSEIQSLKMKSIEKVSRSTPLCEIIVTKYMQSYICRKFSRESGL